MNGESYLISFYFAGRVEPQKIETSESKSMVVKPKIPKFKVDDVKTWTRASSQNLSSVLNDPRRHGRQAYLFTQLWGESFVPQDVVPLTLLPNIPKKYFDGYVKRMEFVSLLFLQQEVINEQLIKSAECWKGKIN